MSEPILTALSHSAGVQSQCLLEMVLRGDIPRPKNFIVLNANPGMEDERTLGFVDEIANRCTAAGISYIKAKGPNLYHDLTTFKERGLTRLDNPPYWTLSPDGKRGRMRQKCTPAYKIAPMRQALRQYMFEKFGVSKLSKRLPQVEQWIGFAADEAHRVSASEVKFITLRFPLIERSMTKAKCAGYFLQRGIERPPSSVCNACFANGLSYLEDMYHNRQDDWERAVNVDESVRDMSQLGIRDKVFVSSTCIPLRDLAKMNFKKSDADYAEHRCNSGACFI